MKLKKLFLSFLVANLALSPFIVSMKTEAVSPMAKVLGATAALSTAGMFWYISNNNTVVNQIAKTGMKQTPQPIAQQIASTITAPITTTSPSFFSLTGAKNAILAVEQLGVKGLEKLSFSINSASIYQFFRNHHEMTAILAFLGVCGAWYSSKKISAWNAHQSKLRQDVLDSIQNNFVQFGQICKDREKDIENGEKPANSYETLPTNTITLTNAQNIVSLPFLKKDQKLIALLTEFYTKCQNVIDEANKNAKPDLSSTTYTAAFNKSSEIKKHLVSLL